MSQNALSRGSKGLVGKGSSLATKNQSAESNTAHSNNQNNNNISALKSKNKQQHNSNDNHNTKHEKESVNPSQSTIIKPTADQLRLAQITGGGKSDDPEINKKIKQVHDVVPFKVQDEILMALHENDYDIAKTIEFFLEGGGDLSQDWKTAGIRTKKPNSSPNQTLEESEVEEVSLVTNQQSNSHRINNKSNSKQNDSQNNAKSRDKNRNSTSGKPSTGGPTGKFIKNKNDQVNNGPSVDESVSNLDDRFANSMELNSRDNNGSADQHNNDQPFYNNNNQQRNNNNRRGNYSLSTRGASTNGGNYRGAGGGRGGGEGGGGGRAGRGRSNYRGGNNSARTHRKEDQIIADTGENHLPAPDEDKSDPLVSDDPHLASEFDVNQENSALFSSQEPLIGEIPIEPINDMLNKKSLSAVRSSREDNLKDIGTWSNEQADKNSSNRSSSSHKSNHFVNASNNNRQSNRYNNNNNNHNTNAKNGGGVNSLRQNDDWENDEEWQGDLTQTQIFTASVQKKENNAETSIDAFAKPRGGPATVIGAPDQQVRQQFDSDFPIGHFNAEEATQTIKNAVGIGSGSTSSVNKKSSAIPSSAAAVSSSVNNLISEDAQSKEANKQQTITNKQQHQQNIRPNKFGSVKPPPPSTRIPKSAVVMPDGTSGNGFSLDVQFGVDLDSPLSENKAPVTEAATMTNATKIFNEPVGRKLNMVSPQVLHNIPQPSQQPSKPIGQQNVNKPVNSVQTSVSSNSSGSITAPSSSSIGTFTSSTSSTIEKVANVGVVNPVINSSNSLQTNAGVVKLHDNSIVGVGVSANKIAETNSMASSLPTTTIQQANILPHGMDGMKKLAQDNFIDVNKQKQPNHQQQQQQNNYQFQQQMNHLNIQKQQQQQQQQPASMSQKPSHQQYVQNQNDSNILNQQNMNQRENNNSHHYQQQQQQHHQQQQHQQLNVNSNLNLSNSNQIKDSNSNQNISQSAAGNGSQLLNISPQNIANKNSNPNQPNNVQLNQQQLMNANNALNQQSGLTSNAISNAANAAVVAAAGAVNMKQSAMPPPPGVNLVNPNSQFLMSLPFVCYDQQNFPYFDPSQIDGNSLMQMYNHLGLGVPPGVGSAAPTATAAGGATPGGPPYSITDSKFGRSEATNSNSQLNVNAAAAQLSQQQQQQQQQPINLIPGLSNFPFFFHNYYPNMFMSVPNGPQTNPQFQNKPPYNFNNNNAAYDDQNKDYSNYNPQGQIKIPGSNLNNVPEINSVGYQKNVDKSNTGYHTPPPNYPNSLMNQQQQHPNVTGTTGAPPPPAQYAYITSMIGTPGGNPLVHTGLQQENINTRTIGGNNGANNIKPLQKTNYQNSPWN